jgi:uncharacterized membrane protein YcaP (DUF421 family)
VTSSLQIDWNALLVPSVHLGEIFLRGTVIYLFIFFALRMLRREAGSIGISDLLVIVLIADAAQNAMASEYHSLTEGLVLVSTILFWNYSLDALAYRFPRIRWIFRPPPLPLVRNGRLQRQNLRKLMITEDDLMAELREHGVEGPEQVKLCFLEGDGQISVLKTGGGEEQTPRKSRGAH